MPVTPTNNSDLCLNLFKFETTLLGLTYQLLFTFCSKTHFLLQLGLFHTFVTSRACLGLSSNRLDSFFQFPRGTLFHKFNLFQPAPTHLPSQRNTTFFKITPVHIFVQTFTLNSSSFATTFTTIFYTFRFQS